jgi:hypothetical protein
VTVDLLSRETFVTLDIGAQERRMTGGGKSRCRIDLATLQKSACFGG